MRKIQKTLRLTARELHRRGDVATAKQVARAARRVSAFDPFGINPAPVDEPAKKKKPKPKVQGPFERFGGPGSTNSGSKAMQDLKEIARTADKIGNTASIIVELGDGRYITKDELDKVSNQLKDIKKECPSLFKKLDKLYNLCNGFWQAGEQKRRHGLHRQR